MSVNLVARVDQRRARRVRIVLSLLPSLLIGVFALTGVSDAAASEDPEPLEVCDPGRGLARVEADRKPIFVIVLPEATAEAYRAELADRLRRSTRSRLSQGFVVIETVVDAKGGWAEAEPAGPEEKPEPWASARARRFIEARLGAVGKEPVAAILDFAGTVLVRFDGEPPSRAQVNKAVRAALAANAERLKTYERGEKGVEKLGLALKQKKYDEACRILVAVREFELPLESPAARALEERAKELEELYRDRVRKVEKLEKERKLAEAVNGYEQILAAFPLPAWQEEMRTRVGRLWREIYGPTPPGGGGR